MKTLLVTKRTGSGGGGGGGRVNANFLKYYKHLFCLKILWTLYSPNFHGTKNIVRIIECSVQGEFL